MLTFAAFLAGCAGQPSFTDQPGAFFATFEGKFPPADVVSVSDCVFDGFELAQGKWSDVVTRKTTRATGYRVEARIGPFQALIAEIKDSGELALLRTTHWNRANTDKEEAAAKACLVKYAAPAN